MEFKAIKEIISDLESLIALAKNEVQDRRESARRGGFLEECKYDLDRDSRLIQRVQKLKDALQSLISVYLVHVPDTVVHEVPVHKIPNYLQKCYGKGKNWYVTQRGRGVIIKTEETIPVEIAQFEPPKSWGHKWVYREEGNNIVFVNELQFNKITGWKQ